MTTGDVPPVKPSAQPGFRVELDPVRKRQLRPMWLRFSRPAMLVVAAIVTAGLVTGCVPSFSSATTQQPADPASTSVAPPVGVWEPISGEAAPPDMGNHALLEGRLIMHDGCLAVESYEADTVVSTTSFLLAAGLNVSWDGQLPRCRLAT